MPQALRMLLVEDNPRDAELIVAELRRAGFAPDWQRVDTEPAYLAALDGGCDIILADYALPQFSGLRALELLQLSGRDIPLIVVSGTIGEDTAVAAMKQGATDYLLKDRLQRLAPAVNQALEQSRLRRERKQAVVALQASEQKYRELVEHANSIILRWTRDGKIAFLNEFGRKFFGYSEAEIIGRHVVGTIVPEGESTSRDLRQMVERIGAHPETFEQNINENMRRNGERVWVAWTNKPLLDEQGQAREILSIGADITERKRAEEALRVERALFDSLVSTIPDHIYFKDRHSRFVRINDAQAQRFGLRNPNEAVSKTDFDFFTGEHARQAYEDEQRVMNTGEPIIGLEEKETWADGQFTWVSTTKVPLRDADGKITGLVGISRVITERKQAEEALRQSEERYRLLFERAPDLIFAFTPTGAFTSLNPAFEMLTGWPPAQWLGRSFKGLIHPDDQTRADDLFQLLLRRERAPTFELRVRTAAGGIRNVEFTGFYSQLSGARTEVQGIGRDITERKRAEAELRLSQQRLALHVDQTPLAVIEFDLTGRVRQWNPAAVAMFGFSREEAIGQYWTFIVPAAIHGQLDGVWAAIVSQRSGARSNNENITKDGRKINCEWFNTPLVDAGGRTIGVASLIQDVTERKQAETRITEQLGELSRWHDAMLGREDRVIEVKKEVNELRARLGEPPSYPSAVEGSEQ